MTQPKNIHDAMRRALALVYAVRNDLRDYLERPEEYHAPEYFQDPYDAVEDALCVLQYVKCELSKNNKWE